ncbi:MAG: LrgB family protein [Succinivibrionaceae bacterium]
MNFNEIFSNFFNQPTLFYIALPLTIFLYISVRFIQQKIKWAILNPLLISVIIIICIILFFDENPSDFQNGIAPINFLLEPSIVALAIPLYMKFDMIKKQAFSILCCCSISILISFFIAYITCHLFGVNENLIPTIGARSITTPLAMNVSDNLGGIASITACIVCCVGILGAVIGFPLMKLFHVRNPKAQGLAIGACAHAVGTSAANEHGETEGAYSSLSLIVCGILTTFLATPIFIILEIIDKVLGL